MMKNLSLFLLLLFGTVITGNLAYSYAVDFTYQGYIPKWAIPMDNQSALGMCGMITHESKDKSWCDAFGKFVNYKWQESKTQNVYQERSNNIPSWIKNNAKWWSENQIDDETFVSGIKFLVTEKILVIPPTTEGTSTFQAIPSWIKNTVGFWADGSIEDSEFLSSMQFLIKEGILIITQQSQIHPPSLEANTKSSDDFIQESKYPIPDDCKGSTICVYETVVKIVDGDTIYTDNYKIRLSLTNTPEINQSGYSEATTFTVKRCPVGSTIQIDQDDLQPYDRYGRLLANVICDGKSLNSELLYFGHANILTQYCHASEFSGERWAQTFGCETKLTYSQLPQYSKNKTTKSTNDCDPSYPDFCIPPPPPDLDCRDIPQKNFTVLQPDPHRFDGDQDRIGCES